MRRLPVLAVVAVAFLMLVATVGQTAAHAQPPSTAGAALNDPAGLADEALIGSLDAADLLDDWLAASHLAAQVAMLEVDGGSEYVSKRQLLLDQLATIRSRVDHVERRESRLALATDQISILGELIRDLRRQVLASGQTPATSLSAEQAHTARIVLSQAGQARRTSGFSLDLIDLVEYRLGQIRAELAREVEALSRPAAYSGKWSDASIARLGRFPVELAHLQQLVERSRESTVADRLRIASEQAVAREMMPRLHELRTTASTSVAGLPAVTIDAYLRGAELNQSRCTIDWTLLGGIGRIESRHGTIGGSRVLASGRVSQPIYGPLLDGGATAAEAAAAAKRAEEEAELLAAEEEAAAAEEAERQAEAFDANVWGGETILRAQEQADASAEALESQTVDFGTPPDGDQSDEADEESDEAGEGNEDDEDEEEEDDGPQGNGFAVIVDSDNGRLDGNSRWDRAVGPMQFIPETWSYFETDGDGDGIADPQNLYDAAASAGRFLCHLKAKRGGSPYNFVLGYNSSETYVRNVMAVADELARAELPTVDPAAGS